MTLSAPLNLQATMRAWNAFFHGEADATTCTLIRRAFAVLVLANFALAYPHVELFWSDAGLLPLDVSRRIANAHTWTVFSWLPNTRLVLWSCYWCAIGNGLLLAFGISPRVNAAALFVWLVSFQHRNILVLTGQDVVFRVLAFLLIFLPVYRSGAAKTGADVNATHAAQSGWALRVIQIEMCLILFSSGVEKLGGSFWWSGDAMYYVMRLDDFCCHYPIPELVRSTPFIYRLMTWSALLIELFAPLAIWFSEFRRPALIAIVALHLCIEYMMNLYLFEWIMIAGWLSHTEPQDFIDLRAAARRLLKPFRRGSSGFAQ